MLDLPPGDVHVNEAPSHFEQVISNEDEAVAVEMPTVQPGPTSEELKAQAVSIKEIFGDGFQWSDIAKMVRQAYVFMLKYEHLSSDEMQEGVVTLIHHIIDITDTPYLPDRFTDPVFKAMVPPFISLFGEAFAGKFPRLPSPASRKPSAEALLEFAKSLKDRYEDGFQWSDISTSLRDAVQYIGSFPFLTREEKKECVVKVLNDLIDITDTPYLPDMYSDPIFKSLVKPFVEEVFEYL